MNIFVISVQALLIIVIVVMIILEVFLSLNDIEGDTISGIIKNWAYSRSFFIMLAWGIVTGHLFLGSKTPLIANDTLSVIVVAVIVCVVVIIGRILKSVKISRVLQFILFIGGALIGHLIWSMNDVINP